MVMGGIANQEGADIALVFGDDDGDLLGIFTEADYIKVRMWSLATSHVATCVCI